jgi:hypothetical protein
MLSITFRLMCVSVALAAGIFYCGEAATARAQPTSPSWLDRPLHNWNKPGGKIPQAPPPTFEEFSTCKGLIRQPAGDEDRAVMAAGWQLVGASQTLSGTTLIVAESGADAMCRPRAYQEFVFVNQNFAGTISPIPMNSRKDGSTGPPEIVRPDSLTVSFNRYKNADALCCPSSETRVSYKIETVNGLPLLVPLSAATSSNAKN